MARAPEIPAAALASIARQVGARMPAAPAGARSLAEAAAAPAVIGESFPVYMLGLDKIQGGERNLPDVVRQTGVWQHQVRHGSQAQEIARSLAPPPGADSTGGQGWLVQEVVRSPVAPRIEEAISWIDQNVPEDAVASILVVPAFYLTAFWLHEPTSDRVVIADMPAGLGNLQPLQLYSAEDFLNRLAALEPSSGVPVGNPPGAVPPASPLPAPAGR